MNTECEGDERGGRKITWFCICLYFLRAASAVTLSNAGEGSWAYYKEIIMKEGNGKYE